MGEQCDVADSVIGLLDTQAAETSPDERCRNAP